MHFDIGIESKKVWGDGESKLRCVSSIRPPFALLCFDKPPGNPPIAQHKLASLLNGERPGYCAHSRQFLSHGPETFPGAQWERHRGLSLVAPRANLQRTPTTCELGPDFIPTWKSHACALASWTCAPIRTNLHCSAPMASPQRALVITAVIGLLLYIFSFPFRAGVVLCIVTFLISGRAYMRLFVKTFPRDLW